MGAYRSYENKPSWSFENTINTLSKLVFKMALSITRKSYNSTIHKIVLYGVTGKSVIIVGEFANKDEIDVSNLQRFIQH